MRRSRGPRASARRPAWRPPLNLLLALLLSVAACDELGPSSTGTVEAEELDGVWTTTAGDLTLYVIITSSTIEVLEGIESACFNVRTLEIVAREGETFTLQEEGATGTFTATLRLEEGRLRAEGLESSVLYLDSSSQDPSGFPECSLDGTWLRSQVDYPEYLVITDTSFTVYTPGGDGCHEILLFDIVSQAGDEYILEARYQASSMTLTMVNLAGTLELTFPDGETAVYAASTDDPATLNVCGGGDESTVSCASLPALAVGQPLDGDLAETDPADPHVGAYYDLYGLTLARPRELRIGLASLEIDPFLRLWSADGSFVAANDDADNTTYDSALIITLDAACYVVEASSWGANEVGVYTLTVD